MPSMKKSLIFLALTFAVSWTASIGGWALGAVQNPLAAWGALTAMMAGPSIAAVICAFAFEKGRRIEALGLRFKPNLWWLAAYLAPIAICALSLGATVLLSGRPLADLDSNLRTIAEQAGQDTSRLAGIPLTPLVLVQSLVIGALINAVALTFTEELGWRGYLYGLWRPAGFWRTSLTTGVIWGLWHAPAIYLYGLNYPNDRLLGIGLFTAYCTLLAPLVTLMRERGGSTWAAGIFHGVFNAVAGLSILWLSDPSFPWNGVVGIGGFVALAVGVAAAALLRPGRTPA